MVTLVEMKSLGWSLNGEAWKWSNRMFAWKEELVKEYDERLTSIVLQVNATYQWFENYSPPIVTR